MERIKKGLFLLLGSLALGAGFIGVFLPLIPTTPFLLLASFFFVRSSERCHRWMLNNKYLGTYLSNYENRSIRRNDLRTTLVIMWVGMAACMVFIDKMTIKGILLLIAVGVTWHLMSLKRVD